MFKTNADVALHLHYFIMTLKVRGKEWLRSLLERNIFASLSKSHGDWLLFF